MRFTIDYHFDLEKDLPSQFVAMSEDERLKVTAKQTTGNSYNIEMSDADINSVWQLKDARTFSQTMRVIAVYMGMIAYDAE